MSPPIVGLVAIIAFFILLAIGVPIGIGMAIIATGGMWYVISGSAAIAQVVLIPFETISSYSFAVLPLFIFMANIVFNTGLGTKLYDMAARWLGRQRGGLAMATVGGCAMFAAMSASSLATAMTIGRVADPEMRRYNYDPALITGCIAAGGTIGILIPPSSVLILYGIITEQSIGKLFAAGIIPGILEAVFYMVTIYVLCRWKPNLGPRGPRYSLREKMSGFKDGIDVILLIILIMGGLIIGWFTPNEAGAIGAFGAIAISLVRRRLNWEKFKQSILDTVKTTGMIYGILIGAVLLKYFLAVTTIPFLIADIVGGLPLPPLGTMGLIILSYIFLGCFLDPLAMVLLTIPMFFPLTVSLGFDPIWFGIIIVRVTEMANITPPVGMIVYAISGIFPDVPMQTIFKGIIPFVIADILHVLLLLFVPAVALFIPNLMTL